MTQPSSAKVIVIGAGLAGLAAARQLAKAGIQVTVLEKDPHLGGRAATLVDNGFAIDMGAGFLANFYTYTLALIRELGLEQELVPIHGGGALLVNGRLRPLSALSLSSKLALCKVIYPLFRHWRELDIHAFHKAYRLDTNSITGYALQKLNPKLLESLIQPLLSGLFYWTPEQTSQAMLFLLAKSGLGLRRFTLRHGVGQLATALATDLHVINSTEVYRVISNPSGGYTVLTQAAGQKRSFVADGIVCTVPATMVNVLFNELNEKQRTFFAAISYSSTAIAAIALARRTTPGFRNLFVPRNQINLRYLGAATSLAAKNPAQVPAGHELLRLFSSVAASQMLLAAGDVVIHDRLVADLHQTELPFDCNRDELFYRVYRWHQALPQFDVGHFQRLKAFANGEIESNHVVFAGDYLGGPFIEGAITSGLKAGDRLLSRLTTSCP